MQGQVRSGCGMNTSGRKAKGRKFQNYIRDMMLLRAPSLTPDDVRSTSMGVTGPDIQLSTAAKLVYPWVCEIKCQERLNIWKAWEQAVGHIPEEDDLGYMPILFIKKNRSDALVVLRADDFFDTRFKLGQQWANFNFDTEGDT